MKKKQLLYIVTYGLEIFCTHQNIESKSYSRLIVMDDKKKST